MLRILGDKAPSLHGSSSHQASQRPMWGGGDWRRGWEGPGRGGHCCFHHDKRESYLRAAAEGKCNLKLLTALSSPANCAEAIRVGTQVRPFSEAQGASWAASRLTQRWGRGARPEAAG